MSNISNDQELRAAVDGLSVNDQRALAARFANSVAGLTDNNRLQRALEVAMEPDITDHEREDAYKAAKSISVQTYTSCGRDADWEAQAEHFVAAACTVALTPDSLIVEKMNLACSAASLCFILASRPSNLGRTTGTPAASANLRETVTTHDARRIVRNANCKPA